MTEADAPREGAAAERSSDEAAEVEAAEAAEVAEVAEVAEAADPPSELEVPLPVGTSPEAAPVQIYEGRFDIDRLPQGKRFQGSWLQLDSGDRLVLSYRPMPEHFALVGKRVVLEGRPYSPGGQRIGGRHVRVESIRLAEGETALAEAPTSLPVPRRFASKAELGVRVGRWVQVFATLVGEREGAADGDWRTLEFRLDDGEIIVTVEASWVVDKAYRPHFGERVSLLGKVYEREGVLGLGPVEACLGEVLGCGMTAKGLRR